MSFVSSSGNISLSSLLNVHNMGFMNLSGVISFRLMVALSSKFDSKGQFIKDILEDGLSGANIDEFVSSSGIFLFAVFLFLLFDLSKMLKVVFSLLSEFLSSDQLLLGEIELGFEVNEVSVKFLNFVSEVTIFSEKVGLEDGEVLSCFNFTASEFVSAVFEVEDKCINHSENLGFQFLLVNGGFLEFGGSESLELSSVVINMAFALFGDGSTSSGSISVGLGA